jgi:hypothetical protein
MKIRCIVLRRGALWVALSLEFGLGTQADTELEAKQKLKAQIDDYIAEANGIDIAHREYLLNRKAPFESYLLYYWLVFKSLWIKDHSPLFSQSTNAHA